MRKIALTAALMMMATSALAQSAAEKTGVNSAMGIAPKTEDFVKEVSMSDMFEIESSKLAVERSEGATKTFAEQMVTDHTKTTTELKGLIDSGKVKAAPATAMSEDQQEMITALKELQGDEFTKQYHDDQVEAHEDAVDLFKRYAEEGENADLKAWAAKTLPALEHHYKMAQDLDKS
jgi:putative membrane protein